MKTLIADSFGAFVGKKSQRVQVRQKGKVLEGHPFFELERIVIASPGVSISSDLLYECVSFTNRPDECSCQPRLFGSHKCDPYR